MSAEHAASEYSGLIAEALLPPQVDGKPNDAVWQNKATLLPPCLQPSGLPYLPLSVRICADEQALYLLIRLLPDADRQGSKHAAFSVECSLGSVLADQFRLVFRKEKDGWASAYLDENDSVTEIPETISLAHARNNGVECWELAVLRERLPPLLTGSTQNIRIRCKMGTAALAGLDLAPSGGLVADQFARVLSIMPSGTVHAQPLSRSETAMTFFSVAELQEKMVAQVRTSGWQEVKEVSLKKAGRQTVSMRVVLPLTGVASGRLSLNNRYSPTLWTYSPQVHGKSPAARLAQALERATVTKTADTSVGDEQTIPPARTAIPAENMAAKRAAEKAVLALLQEDRDSAAKHLRVLLNALNPRWKEMAAPKGIPIPPGPQAEEFSSAVKKLFAASPHHWIDARLLSLSDLEDALQWKSKSPQASTKRMQPLNAWVSRWYAFVMQESKAGASTSSYLFHPELAAKRLRVWKRLPALLSDVNAQDVSLLQSLECMRLDVDSAIGWILKDGGGTPLPPDVLATLMEVTQRWAFCFDGADTQDGLAVCAALQLQAHASQQCGTGSALLSLQQCATLYSSPASSAPSSWFHGKALALNTHAQTVLTYWAERMLPSGTCPLPQTIRSAGIDEERLAAWAETLCPDVPELGRFRPEGLIAAPYQTSAPDVPLASPARGVVVMRSLSAGVACAARVGDGALWLGDRNTNWAFPGSSMQTLSIDSLKKAPAYLLKTIANDNRWMQTPGVDLLMQAFRQAETSSPAAQLHRAVCLVKGNANTTYALLLCSPSEEAHSRTVRGELVLTPDAHTQMSWQAAGGLQCRLQAASDSTEKQPSLRWHLPSPDASGGALLLQKRAADIAHKQVAGRLDWLSNKSKNGLGVCVRPDGKTEDVLLTAFQAKGRLVVGKENPHALDGRFAFARFIEAELAQLSWMNARHLSFAKGGGWQISFSTACSGWLQMREGGSVAIRIVSETDDPVVVKLIEGKSADDVVRQAELPLLPHQTTVFRLLAPIE